MSKPDQYETIGKSYERVKYLPTGISEQATVLSVLPDLRGRSVLDVACGTGFYSRLFKRLGARQVVGVDVSAEMVRYAHSVEAADPLGISYETHDATRLPRLGSFDVVTAIWVPAYAEDESQLVEMVRHIRANLVQEGVLVMLCPNPDISWATAASRYPKYGLAVTRTQLAGGRQGCRAEVLPEPRFAIEAFFWSREVLVRSLRRGGFDEPSWHPAIVSDEALAERGADFWADFLENPTFAVATLRPVPADQSLPPAGHPTG
jgi:toxoflavin synthase